MYTRTPGLDFGSRSPSAFAGCKDGANGVAMSLVRIRPGGERCQQPGRVLSRRATMQSAISPSFSLRRQRLGPSAGSSDEHTYELQSLMRISYAVFCLYKTQKRHSIYRKYRA